MAETASPTQTLNALEDTAFRRLIARLALVRAYLRHREEHHLSDTQALEETAERFAERAAEVDAWVYEVYDGVSGRTLRRWAERLAEGGLAGLADDHGPRSERTYTSYFDPGTEMRKVALYFLADHPRCTSGELLDELRRHFDESDLPDRRTVQRFLKKMAA